jgi:hypothetical protein
MRRRILPVQLVIAMLLLAAPLAGPGSPADAADLTGCSGSATSFSDRGIPLDKVSDTSPVGTKSRPFEIMWNGRIEWQGQTDQVLQNGTWHVNVGNLPRIILGPLKVAGYGDGVSGKIANEKGEMTKTDAFEPSSKVAVMFPGTYEVTFTATGQGGAECTGTVWVKVVNSPTGTPLWWSALVLILIALIMFMFAGYAKWLSPILSRPGP